MGTIIVETKRWIRRQYTAVAVQHEERGVLQKIPYFIHFKSEDFFGKWKRM
jgi:hypothetical protein